MKVFDAKNAVLGRLASATARQLLAGEEVAIVNTEKSIITGDPKVTVIKYIERRQRGTPQHGPFFPTQPHTIVRRAIRGMLPYKTPKGRVAMKKLRVYIGVPEQLADKGTESVAKKLIKSDFITVGELARILGWRTK